MLYLNAIRVCRQNVTTGQTFHPGQWIREGYGDKCCTQRCIPGRIKSTGEDIITLGLRSAPSGILSPDEGDASVC